MSSTHDTTQRVKDYLERLSKRTYRTPTPTIFGSTYFWVFGWTKLGKKVVWGPHYSLMEAEHELEVLEDGEVFELDTRDTSRATREIKAQLLKRGGDPDEALKRVIHKREEV